MSSALSLAHRFVEGDPAAPVLLLLHGTGGSPEDLFPLAEQLSADSAILAPAGPVSEHGMARWFRRLSEGVFDHEDVAARAHQLADFIVAARESYELGDRPLIAVGFSNGANIAAATVLLRPDALSDAALFAAMLPLPEPPAHDLTSARIFLSNGQRDPMAPRDSAEELVRVFTERSAYVRTHWHAAGHQITLDGIHHAQGWMATVHG